MAFISALFKAESCPVYAEVTMHACSWQQKNATELFLYLEHLDLTKIFNS